MAIKFKSTNPPIGLADIDEVESELGMKFPDQYKQFLLLINGGEVKITQQLVPYFDRNLNYASYRFVRYFCGILQENAPNQYTDIRKTYYRNYSDDPEDNRMLPECIPIAWDDDGGHSFFGISISPDFHGKIFLWHDWGLPTYTDAHLIADSFDDFITLIGSKTLKDYDEGKLIE